MLERQDGKNLLDPLLIGVLGFDFFETISGYFCSFVLMIQKILDFIHHIRDTFIIYIILSLDEMH